MTISRTERRMKTIICLILEMILQGLAISAHRLLSILFLRIIDIFV